MALRKVNQVERSTGAWKRNPVIRLGFFPIVSYFVIRVVIRQAVRGGLCQSGSQSTHPQLALSPAPFAASNLIQERVKSMALSRGVWLFVFLAVDQNVVSFFSLRIWSSRSANSSLQRSSPGRTRCCLVSHHQLHGFPRTTAREFHPL